MDLLQPGNVPSPTGTLWILPLGLLLLRRLQVRRGRRNLVGSPAPQLLRPGTVLGFLLTIPHPADAYERRPLLPSRPKLAASEPPGGPAGKDLPDGLLAGPGTPPPWEKDGAPGRDAPSRHRQEVPDETKAKTATAVEPTAKSTAKDDGAVPPAHPAIHGRRRGEKVVTPLFPRTGRNQPPGRSFPDGGVASDRPGDDRAELLACMRRHPAGKKAVASACDASRSRSGCRYVVRRGDTLWGLAAAHLQTDDVRRIARFWPKIHRHNRDVIGDNPDLLFPGQVLEIPLECE